MSDEQDLERAFILRWHAQGILANSKHPRLERQAISMLLESLELGDSWAAWECATLLDDKSLLFHEVVEWAAMNGSPDAALRMRDKNRCDWEKKQYWAKMADSYLKRGDYSARRALPPGNLMSKIREALLRDPPGD